MIRALLLLVFSALAWLVWQQPAPAPTPATVRSSMPALPDPLTQDPSANSTRPTEKKADVLWRVVTSRLITPLAAKGLRLRLIILKLKPIMFEIKEEAEMHAFDDRFLFSKAGEATLAKNEWLEKGIEASVIKVEDGVYMVGLGRYVQVAYAEKLQERLKKIGKPYRYQLRNVPVPTWRFTFAAGSKQQAEKIWKKLQSSGISMPVMMPEKAFQETFANRNEILQP